MKIRISSVVASLLVPILTLDPASASILSDAAFSSSRLIISQTDQAAFDQEALSVPGAAAWAPDALGHSQIPATVRHVILQTETSVEFNRMFIKIWNNNWEQETKMKYARETEWHRLTLDRFFMTYKYGAPERLPGLQNIAYQLVGQLIYEIAVRQDPNAPPEDRLKRGSQTTRWIIRALHKHRTLLQRYNVFTTADDHYDPPEIEEYMFPNPADLKRLLIWIQSGELQLPPMPDFHTTPDKDIDAYEPIIEQKVIEALASHDLSHVQEIQREVKEGFPAWPASIVERKRLVRRHLLRIAEHYSQFFEARKIDEVLAKLDFTKFKGEQVLVVDPYSWSPESQTAEPLGVLPREVAEEVGACHVTVNAFIQLSNKRYVFIVKAMHRRRKNDVLTYAPVGGKSYIPNKPLLSIVTRKLARQLRFAKTHKLKGRIEEINSVNVPIYGDIPQFEWANPAEDKVFPLEDVVFPSVYNIRVKKFVMYLTPEDEEKAIERQQPRLEHVKLRYPTREAYEEALLKRFEESPESRWDTLSIITISRADLDDNITYSKDPGRFDKLPLSKREEWRGYKLVEHYSDEERTSIVIPDPDLVVRVMWDSNQPVHQRFHKGISYEPYFSRRLAEYLEKRQKPIPDIHQSWTWEMQSRFERYQERYGWPVSIVVPLIEEFYNWVLDGSFAAWMAGHGARLAIQGIDGVVHWIGRDHPLYRVARQNIETKGRKRWDFIASLRIGRWGRFAVASGMHLWSNLIHPRLAARAVRSSNRAGRSS